MSNIKAGDLVETVIDLTNQLLPEDRRFLAKEVDIAPGCKFKVEDIRSDGMIRYKGGCDPNTNPRFGYVSQSAVRKIEEERASLAWIPYTIGTGLSIGAIYSISKNPEKVMQFTNDPIIHRTIEALIVTVAGLLGINLSWWTFTNVAKGFGKLGDRRRAIKLAEREATSKRFIERDEAFTKRKKEENDLKIAIKQEEFNNILALVESAKGRPPETMTKSRVASIGDTITITRDTIETRREGSILKKGQQFMVTGVSADGQAVAFEGMQGNAFLTSAYFEVTKRGNT